MPKRWVCSRKNLCINTMKICLFSDLHAHPYTNGKLLEHGTNSRVLDATNVIDQVYDHAKSINADWVFFGGDLFDRRKSIDVDTYNKVRQTIVSSSQTTPTILVVGNHDQANRSGTIHALECFASDGCSVSGEPRWWDLGDSPSGPVRLFSVPYYDDGTVIAKHVEDALLNVPQGTSKKLLLIHYGIQGAKIGPGDYVLPCELKLPMLHPDKWDIIFSGHYHIGQQIGPNFHYIGSAMQHRWDDAGFDKSFVVYDTETGQVSRVNTNAPTFLVTDCNLSGDLNNSFVRIVIDDSISDDEKRSLLDRSMDAGALSVEFKLQPKGVEEKGERISFSEDKGFFGIVEDYVKSEIVDKKDLDPERLILLGKDIIKKAV